MRNVFWALFIFIFLFVGGFEPFKVRGCSEFSIGKRSGKDFRQLKKSYPEDRSSLNRLQKFKFVMKAWFQN